MQKVSGVRGGGAFGFLCLYCLPFELADRVIFHTGTALHKPLLCEASSLGVPSVFPKNGGISEFFDSNYILSFDSRDQEGLISKLKLLDSEDMLKKTSISVSSMALSSMAIVMANRIFKANKLVS